MLLLREKSGQAFGDQMAWEQAHHLQVVVGLELIQVSPACTDKVFVLYNIAAIMTINFLCGCWFNPSWCSQGAKVHSDMDDGTWELCNLTCSKNTEIIQERKSPAVMFGRPLSSK